MPSTQAVRRARPSVAWTKLPDGAVLFAPESEVYYSLNQTGSLIWELLASGAGGYDLDSLSLAVHERFPVASPQQIREDVDEILTDLERNRLLEETEQRSVA